MKYEYWICFSALTMSVAEAEVRMTALRAREKIHDLKYWMDSFLTQLRNSSAEGANTEQVN